MKTARTLSLICFVLFVTACATQPQLKMPPKQVFITTPAEEVQLGEYAFDEIRRKRRICQDAQVCTYIDRVARRAVGANSFGGMDCEIAVFDDDAMDAFALPGGKIGVHTGILPLAGNESGLAAVLDEVISHVTERQGGQRYAELSPSLLGGLSLTTVLFRAWKDPESIRTAMAIYGLGNEVGIPLPYGPVHLEESDRLSLTWMARAGYDPREDLAFWKRLTDYPKTHNGQIPAFLKLHPCDESRLHKMEDFLPTVLPLYRHVVEVSTPSS